MRVLRRDLRLDLWFPHVPLAFATAFIGILQGSPSVVRLLQNGIFRYVPPEHVDQFRRTILHGASNTVIEVLLTVMAVGLLFRSRMAWVVAMVLLSTGLAVNALHPGTYLDPTVRLSAVVVLLLLLTWRTFSRSSLATTTMFAVASIVALIVYGVVGSYEIGDQFQPPIDDAVTALYFAFNMMSTVGYSINQPQTVEAKLFIVTLIVVGITVFTAAISTVLGPLITGRITRLLNPGETPMERTGHYVIVGDTALALSAANGLRKRGQRVTFIIQGPPAEKPADDMDVIAGNPTNLDVLRQAGAHRAKALLALGDDDSENAFVVLAMKELNGQVKTASVVRDAHNLASMKRVGPDLMIAPQILGGELLATALSGEKIEAEKLMSQLLYSRS